MKKYGNPPKIDKITVFFSVSDLTNEISGFILG